MPMTFKSAAKSLSGVLCAISLMGMPAVAQDSESTQQTDQPANTETAAIPRIVEIRPPADGPLPLIDPVELYNGKIEFDMYRNGSNIGHYKMVFSRNEAGDLMVESNSNIRVKVLFIVAFRMTYEATSVWRDNQLVELSAFTDNNGDERYVEAAWDGTLFQVDGPRGRQLADAPLIPSHHWNVGVTQVDRVLNTLNGQLAEVELLRQGIEKVETPFGTVDAEKFEYTGDLRKTWVWYDADGRWVKMAFEGNDGSLIEYRCVSCGLDQSDA